VIGKRLPDRPLALEGGDVRRLRRGGIGHQVVLCGIGFEVFELELHLLEQATDAFGAGAVLLALQLGDLQLEMGDYRLGGALSGAGVGQPGFDTRRSLLSRSGAFGAQLQQHLEHFNVVRQGRNGGFHNRDGITENRPVEAENAAPAKKIRSLSSALRAPGI
jgi:hypothetical protein